MSSKNRINTNSENRKTANTSGTRPVRRTESKQARVIEMLRRPAGTSISAIMKATGWQPHSVRGFLAGGIRRKLGLTLTSEKTDGTRLYRIVAGRLDKSAVQTKRTAK